MMPFRVPWPVRLAAGVLVLAVVLVYYDAGAAARELGGTRWWLAAPAIAGLAATHLFGAATWRMLTGRLAGTHLGWVAAIRAYYAAQALGIVTPASIGSDAYRARAIHADAGSWRRSVLPVAAHRAASYISLAALAGVAALTIPVAGAVRIALIAVPAVTLLASIYLAKHPPGSFGGRADPMRAEWSTMVGAFALSAAFHVTAVLLTYALVLSVAPDVEPTTALAALMVARVATFLPFTPGGLGLQEGAFVLLLPEGGVSAEAAVAASALTRMAMLVTLALGAVALSSSGQLVRRATVQPETQAGTSTVR